MIQNVPPPLHLITNTGSAAPAGLVVPAHRMRSLHGADFGVRWSFNDPRRDSKRRKEPALGVDLQVEDLTPGDVLDEPMEWQAVRRTYRKEVGGSIPGSNRRCHTAVGSEVNNRLMSKALGLNRDQLCCKLPDEGCHNMLTPE